MITTTSGTRLAAAILLMAACADPDDLLVPSGGASPLATRVRAVTGDAQTGVVDRTLPSPLTVEVRDQDDLPMAGVAVAWSVEPAGEFVALDHFTGADGLASALLKMGGQAGDYEAALEASAGRVVFSATATADQPAQAEPVAGDGQTGVAGSSTPNPVVVLIRDQFGNPAPGAVVTWNSSDLGQAVPAQTMTDAEGLTTTDWILGLHAGTPDVERLRRVCVGGIRRDGRDRSGRTGDQGVRRPAEWPVRCGIGRRESRSGSKMPVETRSPASR